MRYFPAGTTFPPQEWRWPNFSPKEMACRGTGDLGIDEHSMDCLQALRTKLGAPMIIHSAYRSPKHNKAVGGAKNSQHLYAKAFDVSMLNHDPQAFEDLARKCGFTSFGHYPKQNFMHIDTRSVATRWNSGGWFKPRETRFSPEAKPTKKTDAVINAGIVVTAGPIIETALRELAPQLPETYTPYVLGGAAVLAAAVGLCTLLRKHSAEPEA